MDTDVEKLYSGFREMQMLQPTGYDTLNDLRVEEVTDVESLYEAVLGEAMRQPDVVGVLSTGPITLTGLTSQAWSDRHVGMRFGVHEVVWQVRSAPKGRIGKPLVAGEVRKLTVLIRSTNRTSTTGWISTVKIWLLPPASAATRPEVNRGGSTYGTLGIAVQPVHLWEQHGSKHLIDSSLSCTDIRGFHAVHSNYALLVRTVTDGPCIGTTHPQFMQRGHVPPHVLAASLGGFSWPDRAQPVNGVTWPTQSGTRTFDQREWSRQRHTASMEFCRATSLQLKCCDPSTMAARLLFAAEDVFEQVSLTGWIDTMADTFFDNAVPDDVRLPNGLMSIVAIAVRVACNPERWGVAPSTPDDVWASRAMCGILESVQPGVHTDEDTGEDYYAVDLFLEHTIEQLQLSGTHRPCVKDALAVLYNAGIAIAIDVCGTPNMCRDGTSGIYTDLGCAVSRCDPVMQARHMDAYEHGLGNLAPWSVTTRTSTQGARQTTLLRVFSEVERWLLDGTHDGIRLPPRKVMQEEKEPERSMSQMSNPCLPYVATNMSKKKRRASVKRESRTTGRRSHVRREEDEIANDIIRRTKGRPLSEAQALEQVSESMVRKKSERVWRDRIRRRDSLVATSGRSFGITVGDVLQNGVSHGITNTLDVQVFAIGHNAQQRCGSCHRSVNVVAGIAFAGPTGRCVKCSHPRCLVCMDLYIESLEEDNAEWVPNGCSFCV